MSVGGSNQKGRQEQRIKNEITKLGLRYNLLTDYTSFVAVEERAKGKKQLKQPGYRRIPVMMTRDWHGIARSQDLAQIGFIPHTATKRVYRKTCQKILGGHALKVREILRREQCLVTPKFAIQTLPRVRPDMRISSGEDLKKSKEPWYLKLLKTQQADGSFTLAGLKILSSHLRKSLKSLKSFSSMIDGISPDLQEQILSTWLAVSMLSKDLIDSSITGRAIRKAEKWLTKCNAENLTIKGIPIKEAFKNRFRITLD
jgi:hypothetical protein